MMSMTTLKSGAQAKSYYTQDNYYTKQDSEESQQSASWYGRGATLLGLDNRAFDKDRFVELINGEVDENNNISRITKDTDGNSVTSHRPGVDLTFSAPKSVSILAEVYQDQDVRDAHENAVKSTLDFVENEYAQTRISVDGEKIKENTGNMVVALFAHNNSRELDPQTHTHAVIMNATQNSKGAWTAFSNEEIYQNQTLIGAVYNNQLAQNLQDLGYELDFKPNGNFEVKGVDQSVIEAFSQRRQQMIKGAAERGIDLNEANASVRETVALNTRKSKGHVNLAEMEKDWGDRANQLGFTQQDYDQLKQEAQERNQPTIKPINPFINPNNIQRESSEQLKADVKDQSVREALFFAVGHETEKEMVVKRSAIEQTALKRSKGEFGIVDVKGEVDRLLEKGVIVGVGSDGKKLTTTRLAHDEIWSIQHVQAERQGMAKVLEDHEVEAKIIDREKVQGFKYTSGQKDAIEGILTSNSRYYAVDGLAGTGKTTMLTGLNKIASEKGFILKGMSVGGVAAKNLELETGIPSTTMAMFQFKESQLQNQIANSGNQVDRKNEIWVVDESSLTGQQNFTDILRLAKNADARVVFLGDKLQLQAINAGKPFEILQGQMDRAKMQDINRQKTQTLKDVVAVITAKNKNGEVDLSRNLEAFDQLDQQGLVHECGDHLHQAVLNKYMDKSVDDRKNTLIITPYNSDRKVINSLIRGEMKNRNELTGSAQMFGVYERQNLSEAQLKISDFYTKGSYVRFRKDYVNGGDRLEKDAYYQVVGVDGKHVVLSDGRTEKKWNPSKNNQAEAFNKVDKELQTGDQIRITRSMKTIKNGEKYEVVKMEKDHVLVKDEKGKEKEISYAEFGHWDHGYVSTIYSSQGLTKSDVMLAINSQPNILGKVDQKQAEKTAEELGRIFGNRAFYVGVTRAAQNLTVFTNNKEIARDSVAYSQNKSSFIEQENNPLKTEHVLTNIGLERE